MRNLIILSLSTSLIACQEQSTQTQSERGFMEQSGDLNDRSHKSQNEKLHSFERSELPFQEYLIEKLGELEGAEGPSLDDLEPTEAPVDVTCVYGGELLGTIEWEREESTGWDIDLFDENDLQIQDIERLVQPMANAQELSPMDVITEGALSLVLHQEYVDIEMDTEMNEQGELTGEWFICPHYE